MDINYTPLRELTRKLIRFEYDNKNILQPLWHYTSANGFQGIVKNNKTLLFRFTRSDCLNDTSEGSYIDDLFQETGLKMFHDRQISEEYYDIIKECKTDTKKFMSFPVPPSEGCEGKSIACSPDCDAFICCFSLSKDSLDMWRYYSKNDGGYALKCVPLIFEKQKYPDSFKYNENEFFGSLYGFRVVYEKALQTSMVTDILKNCYDAYLIGVPNEDTDAKNVRAIINLFLEQYQFIFKHPCFSTEDEYRFVYFRPKQQLDNLKSKMYDVKYANRKGVIVPYIEIPIENANAYLREVMISPLITDRFAVETAQDYLKSCGFDKCKVTASTLPVRE